ncbi:glutathione synthase [Leucothrix pacifica]|uniref:glutathione synthase n=1 Tax=Leucothrix pacifica TaxID=1247513 RepID=UPI001C6430EC|nr:glutathione synthase [Leucothrix pacifica]
MPKPIIRIGVVMDPIESIKPYKDSSFAMMLEAQRRGWEVHYILQSGIYNEGGIVYCNSKTVHLTDDNDHWFDFKDDHTLPMGELDCVIMRKDPPFDMEYIYSTYLLELAELQGCLVLNRPASIRGANEKFFTTWFADYAPETLVTRDMALIKAFHEKHKRIVVKPLDGMGGSMIFQIREGDQNRSVIIETLTDHGKVTAMAQRFLPEFKEGDKRILLIDGEPFDYALARIPAAGESRGNLAAGATSKGVSLTERDREICAAVGPTLKEMGLVFVGLDVIGDYMTEINVTSPTCIRELDAIYSANIAGLLMDAIETKLEKAA